MPKLQANRYCLHFIPHDLSVGKQFATANSVFSITSDKYFESHLSNRLETGKLISSGEDTVRVA